MGNNMEVNDGKRLAVLSMSLNIALTAVLFTLYLFTGSSALLAESVHFFTDVIASLLIIAGIYLSEKKSEKFPWGLYKVENIAATLLSILIFLSSYEIARTIFKPSSEGIRNIDITLIVLFLMAMPIMLFSRYETKGARKLNSPSLMADALHWKADIAPLAIAAVSLIGAKFSYPVVDKIAASIILVFVVKSGYEIIRDSMKSLLDASVDRKTLKDIDEVIKGFPQVTEIVSLNARNSGRFIFVYLDLSLSLKRLKAAHEVSGSIERKIRENIPFVDRVVIHYEPERKDYLRYAVPLANTEGDISEHFGSAPFIAIWDKRISDAALLSQEMLKNPFLQMEKGKGIRLAELLVEKGIDILYLKEDFEGKGPEYVLSDAEVDVRKTSLQNLKELIELK
ncbi:MAG: cation diffusion facilitator family transporter [Nitrospirota bacterium]